MVRFIRYWIERGMETDEQRAAAMEAHVTKLRAKADDLRKRWDEPLLAPGYWNLRENVQVTKLRRAEAIAQPISPYRAALADIRASQS